MSTDDLRVLFKEENDDTWILAILLLALQPKEPTINIYLGSDE